MIDDEYEKIKEFIIQNSQKIIVRTYPPLGECSMRGFYYTFGGIGAIAAIFLIRKLLEWIL